MRQSLFYFCILFIGFISIDVNAQCFENRHSSNWYDGWISCETAPNPNSDREASHWILYDLKSLYDLERTHFWNYNDVNNLNYGIQDVAIDYSVDGTTWSNIGTFTINQASGASTYEGEAGPDFGGVRAQYVLLTVLSTYGGHCAALSEVKFEAQEASSSVANVEDEFACLTADVFPNPVKTESRVYIKSDCDGKVTYQLYNMLGQSIAQRDITEVIEQVGYFDLPVAQLTEGEYILEIQNEEGSVKKTILKL